jgi:hypothetical protein
VFTNLKAFLAQAGTKIYPGTFIPLTTEETKWFIGLHMIHGLSPSPFILYRKKQFLRVDWLSHSSSIVPSSIMKNSQNFLTVNIMQKIPTNSLL